MHQLTSSPTDTLEIPFHPDLAAVLTALGVPWTPGLPSNGTHGTILVPFDHHLDGRLEQLVGDLSALRWAYTPGRTLQLTLPGVDDDPA